MKGKLLIQTTNLVKNFIIGSQEVPVLKQINIKIQSGEFVIIFGPSGCGKSTFIHTLLGLEKPTKGKVAFTGQDLYSLADDKRAICENIKSALFTNNPYGLKL